MAAHFERTQIFSPATIPLLYSAAMAMTTSPRSSSATCMTALVVMLAYGIAPPPRSVPLGFAGGATSGVVAVPLWPPGRVRRVAARRHRKWCR
jgi:hypothetical protein